VEEANGCLLGIFIYPDQDLRVDAILELGPISRKYSIYSKRKFHYAGKMNLVLQPILADRIHLNFALGKHLEDSKSFEKIIYLL
jgi:hypothetical protein